MAPFGLKLCQNAFWTIPNISFFGGENLKFCRLSLKSLNGHFLVQHGSFGLKLFQNAFETIPSITTVIVSMPKTKLDFGIGSSSFDTLVPAKTPISVDKL